MKRFLQLTVAIMIFGNIVYAQIENKKYSQNERDKQELIRLENATVTASDNRDFAMLDRLIADDFVGTNSRGALKNKAETIASWTGNAPTNSKGEAAAKSVVTTLNDLRVRINGNTAIVTGIDRAVYKNKDGGDAKTEARFTDIWEKRKIGWQLIAGHASRIPPEVSASLAGQQSQQTAAQTEETKLKELRKQWDAAFEARNADRQSSIFAANGIFIAGGPQPLEGRAAYRDSLLRVFKRPNIRLAHEPAKVEVSASGDVAYEIGSWKESWDESDGLTTLTGTYFAVWKKINGDWQVTAQTLRAYNCTGGSYCKK